MRTRVRARLRVWRCGGRREAKGRPLFEKFRWHFRFSSHVQSSRSFSSLSSFGVRLWWRVSVIMTHPKKELTVACNYLLRLMKAHIELTPEQILKFKRAFHDTLAKRFVGHWFPGRSKERERELKREESFLLATPHRGSAYRCLQTKNWKDPILRSIAERSSLPLHRYLPAIFTIWIGKILPKPRRSRVDLQYFSSLQIQVKWRFALVMKARGVQCTNAKRTDKSIRRTVMAKRPFRLFRPMKIF